MASKKTAVRPYTRTEQVQTTLTKAEREQLDARAAALVVSRAELIHRLIVEGLEQDKPAVRAEPGSAIDHYHKEMQRLAALRKANQQ